MPAFSADKAEAIIERELGAPVGQLFASFDRKPIAAASLGQVRAGLLLTGTLWRVNGLPVEALGALTSAAWPGAAQRRGPCTATADPRLPARRAPPPGRLPLPACLQVHRATLLTGESVVVKVQRPGLRQLFEIDLQNLEKVAEQVGAASHSDGAGLAGQAWPAG